MTSAESQITNKLNGTNYAGNSNIEIRNASNNASLIINASTPSITNPSVWIDIQPTDKIIRFYKNIGSGWVSVGKINIT